MTIITTTKIPSYPLLINSLEYHTIAATKKTKDAHTRTLAITFIQLSVFRTMVRSKQSVLRQVVQTASSGPTVVVSLLLAFAEASELER